MPVATLKVTAKGQVTLRKEVLQHLGVEPGDRIEVDLLPGGQVNVHAARPGKPISSAYGFLAGRTNKVATLDELTEAAQKGWAGLLEDHD